MNKFNVVVVEQDGRGNYHTKVIASYDDYEQASDVAYQYGGSVVEQGDK